MIAKLLVWDADRPRAIARMRRALDEFEIEGVPTLLPLHRLIFAHPAFAAGETCAGLVEGELAAQLAPAGPADALSPQPIARRIDVELDGRRHEVRVLEPVVAELAAERAAPRRASGAGPHGRAGGGSIASPMQGTVLRVEVSEGDPVESGKVLVIVEAMKMENEIAADRPGVVSDLRVAPGDAVRSARCCCPWSTAREGPTAPAAARRRGPRLPMSVPAHAASEMVVQLRGGAVAARAPLSALRGPDGHLSAQQPAAGRALAQIAAEQRAATRALRRAVPGIVVTAHLQYTLDALVVLAPRSSLARLARVRGRAARLPLGGRSTSRPIACRP